MRTHGLCAITWAWLVPCAVAAASHACGGGPRPSESPAAATPDSLAPSARASSPAETPTALHAPRASAVAPSVPASISPPASTCPRDMVDVGAACIDRYEAPNEAGATPLVMQSAEEAVAWCTERGKRLCTEDEWLRACQGPGGQRYPYGATYEEHHCNHDAKYRVPNWGLLARWPAEAAVTEASRLNQAEPSGKRPTCGSMEGVFDLTGNVAEWVVKLHDHPEACKKEEERNHRYVVQGCSWVKCFRPPHEPACDYVNCAHAASFRSYEIGFRCCRDRAETGRGAVSPG